MVEPVVQPESGGCGIASAAMLAGLPYAEVKRRASRLGIDAKDATLWSDTRPMRRLLRELGIKAARSERPFTSWEALPDLALLAVKWHLERGVPHWHWVVFARENGGAVVLDPARALKHHVRTDFGRIKLAWSIEIRPR